VGGTLADAVDRRRLLLQTEVALVIVSALLAVNAALPHPQVWALYVLLTLGTTAFMLGEIARDNREDFAFLPVTLSLVLVAGSVALTAAPVPVLVERFSPDRERRPGRLAQGVVGLGLAGFAVFALTGIMIAQSP